MTMRTTLLACVSAVTLLAACGGGSSGSSSDEGSGSSGSGGNEKADTYAGSWRGDCLRDYAVGENPAFPTGKSQIRGYVLTKTGAESLSFAYNVAEYETPDCSGARTALFTTRGVVSLDGAKAVGNIQAERATFTTQSGPVTIGKVLLWVSNGLLYMGTQPPRDAQGYPNQLESNSPLSPV